MHSLIPSPIHPLSPSHFSPCSFSCNQRPSPACSIRLPDLEFTPSQPPCHPADPLSLLLLLFVLLSHTAHSSPSLLFSLGNHVTSLKLSPINQQYLGGSASLQLSDWLLYSHTHTHTVDSLFSSFGNKCGLRFSVFMCRNAPCCREWSV